VRVALHLAQSTARLAAISIAIWAACLAVVPAAARAQAPAPGHRGRASRATRATPSHKGIRVSVQPFEGAGGDIMRALVVRIVRGRGLRAVTTIPRYEGTGQYPGLAKEHHLAAFITAEIAEHGKRQAITFLVWNGLTGSVLGRWSTAAATGTLGRAIGKGFWRALGPALAKARSPIPDVPDEAPPMQIDASSGTEEPLASRD